LRTTQTSEREHSQVLRLSCFFRWKLLLTSTLILFWHEIL